MTGTHRFIAMIHRERDIYVGLCPELDVASQGESVEQAAANLRVAVELFLETADPAEIESRLTSEMYVTAFEVSAEAF